MHTHSHTIIMNAAATTLSYIPMPSHLTHPYTYISTSIYFVLPHDIFSTIFTLITALLGLELARKAFHCTCAHDSVSALKAKANFFINIICEAKGNSKLIWETLKK